MPIPHIPSRLPWLGNTLKFAKDPDEFFSQSASRYGETFSATLNGKHTIFLTNGHDFSEVFRQAKSLSAENSNPEIGSAIFGFNAEEYKTIQHEIEKITKKDMQGHALEPLGIKFQLQLEQNVFSLASENSHIDANRFIEKTLFPAASTALFGQAADDDDILKYFLNLDKPLPLILAGVPGWILPSFKKAQRFLADWMSQSQHDQSTVMDKRHAMWEREGSCPRQRGAVDASVLWAAQANTIPAAIWTIYYVSKNPRIASLVKNELEQVIEKALLKNRQAISPNGLPLFTTEMLNDMEVLDSCIWETLRLTTSTMITREALRPISLQLNDGNQLDLDIGEQILLVTRSMHLDAETFESPQEFRHDRFMKSQAKKYSKNNKTLKYPLLPFGGGQSRCPGMFFAINEFKILLAVLFRCFDFEVKNDAELDFSRSGLGALPPKQKIFMSYSRR